MTQEHAITETGRLSKWWTKNPEDILGLRGPESFSLLPVSCELLYSSWSKGGFALWVDEFDIEEFPRDISIQSAYAQTAGSTWTILSPLFITNESGQIFRGYQYACAQGYTTAHEFLEQNNLTANKVISREVQEQVDALLVLANEEHFEDGMESEFSKKLTRVIKKYGNDAVNVLTNFILSETVSPETAAEALRWIGYLDHPPTYNKRLWLLEKSLSCRSPIIRDGAILGLSYLDDPHAIPFIENAIRHEQREELQKDMLQVLNQLQVDISQLKNAS